MIKHAMSYVTKAEKVMAELDEVAVQDLVLGRQDYQTLSAISALEDAKGALVAAESQLVKAYGQWRAAMRVAAVLGNELAATYIEESTWDLT
jgi:hypothetical protein